ncbi:unnamed protein product [Enterobius vermicularis]|uniref:Elongation of very long chain fatty acids protein n=1 Tax=Enterobius vermicularis TaxID=51028 RepID=A0A0N4V9R2_ENTVE|nr:unnamed protein product [Enterobius vermicularis]
MFYKLNEFDLYSTNTSVGLHNDYKYKYALPFEKIEGYVSKTQFLQRTWHHSITISVVYYIFIKFIQRLMENRKPFTLRVPLIIWNFLLAVFSIIAFTRFTEDVAYSAIYRGIYESLCYSVNPTDVAAFWSLQFAISKIVELGDTIFIVLRKKPLIFLHYYHHAAVLIYTAHSGAEHAGAGRFFVSMNLFAHSIMYSYYACKAYGFKVPRFVAMMVTTVQTVQMLAGVFISYLVYRIKTETTLPCQQSMGNLYLAFFLYTTFAVLFIQFFAKTYMMKARKTTKAE